MKTLPLAARVALVLIGLGVLRFVLPIGVAFAHYRFTPEFREWVSSHPADDSIWRANVPGGVEVSRELPWRSSDSKASDRHGRWVPRVEVRHGDEILVDLELDVSYESREVEDWAEQDSPSEAFVALEVSVKQLTLDPDFHAIAVLSFQKLDQNDGELREGLQRQGPAVQLDVFALSGPGELQVVIQDVPSIGSGPGNEMIAGGQFTERRFGAVRTIIGLVHPLGDPPEEGIAYQARTRLFPSWTKNAGGSGGACHGPIKFGVSSEQYSVHLKCSQATREPYAPADHFAFKNSSEVQTRWERNGQVW